MALTLINPNDVGMPNKVELTPEANLEAIQNTLKNFLAYYYDTGIKVSKSKPRNLIVQRTNGRNLAIKISNHTWNLIPLENTDDVEQIQNIIDALPEYKDRLFAFKKWCNKITGVKGGAKAHPRPEESF